MDNLFTNIERYKRTMNAPLAARMRPQTLEEYVGQTEAVGPGSWLRTAIEHDTLSSVILYGPAGTGKTTLARIIANSTHAEFVEVSAVTGTVKDLRREIEAAESRLLSLGRRTILFVDEIHRFNRSQQDALLHAVEDRTVVLVGATTENPYFEVNSALLSRSRVVELEPLDDDSIRTIVRRAVTSEYGLKGAFTLDDDALEEIVTLAGGDGRASLTSLELARMLDAGEDPKFIARRIFILASEDIGNADPQALLVAEAAFKATEVIGLPECRINLAQAVEYMALAPKSNAAEAGIDAALKEVREGPRREVPSYLRDRHRPGSDEYGPYLYPHNYPAGWVEQRYLPEGLERGEFYHPSPRGWEAWRIEATARDRAGLQPKPVNDGERGTAGAAGADAAANGANPAKNDAASKA